MDHKTLTALCASTDNPGRPIITVKGRRVGFLAKTVTVAREICRSLVALITSRDDRFLFALQAGIHSGINRMHDFDMPIKTGPQLWHHVTYSPLKKFEGQYYDSNGTPIDIKYEKGAMAAINTLSDTLRVWGSYCWSATVEESPELRLKCEAMLLPIIRMMIAMESRPDWWKRSADRLAVYAMRDVRYERPPDGDNSRLSLYDQSQLSIRAGYTPGHFERDCGSQWRYLKLLLDGWCDQAAQPLEDWAREKRRAA